MLVGGELRRVPALHALTQTALHRLVYNTGDARSSGTCLCVYGTKHTHTNSSEDTSTAVRTRGRVAHCSPSSQVVLSGVGWCQRTLHG